MRILESAIDKIKENVQNEWEENKFIIGSLILNVDGKIIEHPAPFSTSESKTIIFNYIVELAKKGILREFIIVSEAWMNCNENALERKRKGESLQSIPGSERAITLSYASPNKEVFNFVKVNDADDLEEWQSSEITIQDTIAFKPRFQSIWHQASTEMN